MGRQRSDRLSDYERVSVMTDADRKILRRMLRGEQLHRLSTHWQHVARPAQLPPPGDWTVWLILAGRAFGKTRAGAEWVRAIAETDGTARIALIGASLYEARAVMVEGESGLLAIAPSGARPEWQPSRRRLLWGNGAIATLFGAADADSLRGPQHSHVWGDEIAKWQGGKATWDNAMMGMRAGAMPQALATTTPRPVPLLRALLAQEGVVVTRGGTFENRAALPPAFLAAMRRDYAGTRFGRQELEGEMILDPEGALWTRGLLERCRATTLPADEDDGTEPPLSSPPLLRRPLLRRVVVGVDPPAGSTGDACGIVVAGITAAGHAYVIDDASVERASPEQWARAVAGAWHRWDADRVVAEANNGGAMVESVLRAAGAEMPVRLVHATRGKSARAEPVMTLYESGRVTHLGLFARLEDEMCGMLTGGGYEGPGRSPDRADALVWALTDLMLGRTRPPGVRLL